MRNAAKSGTNDSVERASLGIADARYHAAFGWKRLSSGLCLVSMADKSAVRLSLLAGRYQSMFFTLIFLRAGIIRC